jgi:hypothetical protein
MIDDFCHAMPHGINPWNQPPAPRRTTGRARFAKACLRGGALAKMLRDEASKVSYLGGFLKWVVPQNQAFFWLSMGKPQWFGVAIF